MDKEEPKPNQTDEKTRNVLCFFCFGILTIVYHESMLCAANDILAGTSTPTAATVLAAGIPQVSIKLVMPWIIQKFPHSYKVVIIFVLYVSGLVTLVCSSNATIRLTGMAFAEAGKSMAEITFISLTTFYGDVTISAFVAGAGTGSLIGPLYYTATTTWFCVAPRIAIAIIIPAVLLFPGIYAILDRNPLEKSSAKPPTHEGIEYKPLSDTDDSSCGHKLTWSRRCQIFWLILPTLVFLFWEYSADYLSNHAVVTTLAFRNAPFLPRDHYLYYILCDRIGKFLGRAYLLIFSYTCPNQVKRVRINRTWILALIGVSHNVFFVTQSWYRFVPHVGVIMALCLTEGFTTGAIYVNSPHVVREQLSPDSSREFGLGLLTLGTATGQLTAGLIGMYAEPALEDHCLHSLKLGVLCSTRFANHAGWSENLHCST